MERIAGFDWDDGNLQKCRRHGVSREEIEHVLSHPISVLPDPEHSQTEVRFKAIGHNAAGRAVFVVFTVRESGSDMLIRPISARHMHQKEVKYYEEEIARAEKRRRS